MSSERALSNCSTKNVSRECDEKIARAPVKHRRARTAATPEAPRRTLGLLGAARIGISEAT